MAQPGSESTSSTSGSTTTLTGSTSSSTAATTRGGSFSDMVKNENKIFTVIGIGTVGETEVRLKTVIDTSSPNPNRWTQLYWRVE